MAGEEFAFKHNLALNGKVGSAQALLSSLFYECTLEETPAHLHRKYVKSGNNSYVCIHLKPGCNPKVLKQESDYRNSDIRIAKQYTAVSINEIELYTSIWMNLNHIKMYKIRCRRVQFPSHKIQNQTKLNNIVQKYIMYVKTEKLQERSEMISQYFKIKVIFLGEKGAMRGEQVSQQCFIL